MIGMEHIGITEEQLNGLGNRWAKKDGEVRWYVNDWQDAIGMEVVYYNTGNVSDVYYHGGNGWHGDGHPSNSWYYKNVAGTKVWLDAQGRVHVDYCKDAGVGRDIIAKVGERIQAAIDAQAPFEAVVEVCAQADAQAPVEEVQVEPRGVPDFGYDYDLDSDLRWNFDRTEAELRVFGTVGGRDAEIVFRAAASEWQELRELFERGDEDALAAWHLAHLESVGWSE